MPVPNGYSSRVPYNPATLNGTMLRPSAFIALAFSLTLSLRAQQPAPGSPAGPVPLQPLAQQARRLETALAYLGQPLSAGDHQALNEAIALTDEAAAVSRVQQILDRFVLATVHINPESRVKVAQGAARPELVQEARGCSSSKCSMTRASPRR
jgi:hypothetical protein